MIDEWFLAEFQELGLRGPRRVAIDVGANVGQWSRWMSLHFDQVLAIEPDAKARQLFYAAGAPRHCALLPVACGREAKTADFYSRGNTSEQSSITPEHPLESLPANSVSPVTVVTLDHLAEFFRHTVIDLVKIDVEGAEADVLAGIRGDAFRHARFIIEIHDRDRQVGEELQRLGYGEIRIKPNEHPHAHENHKWIFVPPLESVA